VEDIITSPSQQDPYSELKTVLLNRLSSRDQCVRQPLTLEEMGDRKPSHFLRHLRSLIHAVPDYFLHSIWTS
jgi:hypothetical protein